jgi:outer membrane cobalamin receptor
LKCYHKTKNGLILKYLLAIAILISILNADEYKIDLMDDVFDMDLQTLQEIKIKSASKSLQSLNFTPARVVVITKETIEQRGYIGLDDLLNDLPGFQIMRYADSGILNQVGIRGVMGSNYFKILQDGIEIDTTDGEVMSISKQYALYGVDRVEILYGAASVIYGADALSGVINIVSSKDPDDIVGVSVGQNGYRYVYGVKSFDLYEGKLILKAHYHHDQDYELEKEYPNDFIPSVHNSEFDFQPHISKSISAKYTKGGFDMGINYKYSSESTLIAMNGKNSISNVFDNDANLNSVLFGTYARYSADIVDSINSTTTLSYDFTELLIDSNFNNKYTSYEPKYKYSKSQRYAIEETLTKKIKNHQITFGFSYEKFKSTPMTYDLETQSLDNVYYAGSNNTIAAPIYTIEWNNIAIYLQDQIAINENLQLSLAARYDESSSYGSTLNPRIALIHSKDNLTQKLIYSQAYLAPSNYQKYKIYGTPLVPNTQGDGNTYQTSTFRVANPDLKPETSKSYEYSVDWLLKKNDLISLSLYYSKIEDMILTEEAIPEQKYFIPDTTILDPRGAVNSASSEIYGGDIAYQAKKYFSGYDLSYWINYSYIDGKINSNIELPFLSSHTLKSGFTLRYRKLNITPSFRWVSPITASHYVDGEISSVSGHSVANLFSSYNFTKDTKISLKIDNIFDKHYYGVRYNTSSKYKSPQDARLISMAFSMKF